MNYKYAQENLMAFENDFRLYPFEHILDLTTIKILISKLNYQVEYIINKHPKNKRHLWVHSSRSPLLTVYLSIFRPRIYFTLFIASKSISKQNMINKSVLVAGEGGV